MKRILIYVISIMLAHASQSTVRENDAEIIIKNSTGYQIESIFLATSKSTDWGLDYLNGKAMENGKSQGIKIKASNGHCIYDLKIHWVGYGDNEDTIWAGLNLCTHRKVTLMYDGKTGKTYSGLD